MHDHFLARVFYGPELVPGRLVKDSILDDYDRVVVESLVDIFRLGFVTADRTTASDAYSDLPAARRAGIGNGNGSERRPLAPPHSLAGITGDMLANNPSRHGPAVPGADKDKAELVLSEAQKLARYYTTAAFAGDLDRAEREIGAKSGGIASTGFVFAEIWLAVKRKMQSWRPTAEGLGALLDLMADGVLEGYARAQAKLPGIFEWLAMGGVDTHLQQWVTQTYTELLTTGKLWMSRMEHTGPATIGALKVLMLNPKHRMFSERLHSAMNLLAAGVSDIAAKMVARVVGESALAGVPVVGPLAAEFSQIFLTGVMSCAMVHLLDTDTVADRQVAWLRKATANPAELELRDYRKQARVFESLAAQVMSLDPDEVRARCACYKDVEDRICSASNDDEIAEALRDLAAANEAMSFPRFPWHGADYETDVPTYDAWRLTEDYGALYAEIDKRHAALGQMSQDRLLPLTDPAYKKALIGMPQATRELVSLMRVALERLVTEYDDSASPNCTIKGRPCNYDQATFERWRKHTQNDICNVGNAMRDTLEAQQAAYRELPLTDPKLKDVIVSLPDDKRHLVAMLSIYNQVAWKDNDCVAWATTAAAPLEEA